MHLHEIHHSPLIACGEGVGGGVLVSHSIENRYSNFTEFNGAISNCINTANTDKQEKLDSLLSLNFETFQKVQVLIV
jgi:hypothetical protein